MTYHLGLRRKEGLFRRYFDSDHVVLLYMMGCAWDIVLYSILTTLT